MGGDGAGITSTIRGDLLLAERAGAVRSASCPRCGGALFEEYGDTACLACGYRTVGMATLTIVYPGAQWPPIAAPSPSQTRAPKLTAHDGGRRG